MLFSHFFLHFSAFVFDSSCGHTAAGPYALSYGGSAVRRCGTLGPMTSVSSASRNLLKTLQIVWIANVSAPIIYGVVLFLLLQPTRETFARTLVTREPLLIAFQIIALILFFAAMALSRFLLRAAAAARPRIAPTFEIVPATRKALMVRWAMFSGVAALGLLTAFLGNSRGLYIPFFLASLIGFLSSFPSERFIRSAQGELI